MANDPLWKLQWSVTKPFFIQTPIRYALSNVAREYIPEASARPDFQIYTDFRGGHSGIQGNIDGHFFESMTLNIRCDEAYKDEVLESFPTNPLPLCGEKLYLTDHVAHKVKPAKNVDADFVTYGLTSPFTPAKFLAALDRDLVEFKGWHNWRDHADFDWENIHSFWKKISPAQISRGFFAAFRNVPLYVSDRLFRFGLGKYRTMGFGVIRRTKGGKNRDLTRNV
jgi:hypothetical protein